MEVKKAKAWTLLFVGASFLITGCELPEDAIKDIGKIFGDPNQNTGDPPEPPNVESRCYHQRMVQPGAQLTRKLDLLFVTDTSGSLYAERGEIADGIDAFVREIPAEVDINIGVLLGHGRTSRHAGRLYRRSFNNPLVLKSSELTISEIRSYLRNRLVNTVGDWTTDGGEAGLWALDDALRGSKLEELRNAGMIREDAALAVIFIADENAICARYPQGVNRVPDPENLEIPAFNEHCSSVTHESVVDLVRNVQNDQPMLIGGIVYSDIDGVPRGGENEYGWGYMEAIERANGVAINLANGHYDRGLAEIGRLTSIRLNLITEMILAHTQVDPATIEVKVDGATANYNYNASTNILHLLEPGGPLSVVDVNYCLKDNGGGGGGGCTGLNCGGGGGIGV